MIDEFAKEYLHGDLRDARATMLWKLDGLAEYDVRRPLTPTGTNLLGLIKHLTLTEAWYFGEVFGRPFPERLPWRDNTGDEPTDDAKLTARFEHTLQLADMWATEDESRREIVDRYTRMCAHSDATIAALDIDASGHVAWWPRPDVKLFNILVHVLNETNRHAGHADILREQLDGAVGTEAGSAVLYGGDTSFWENQRAKIERAARAAARSSSMSPSLRLQTICIDCADAHVMAEFYGRLLGWDVTFSEPGWVLMRDPDGATGLSFQAEPGYREPTWPEQEHGQDKMLHLDIKVDDLDAAVEHAVASGARPADYQPQERVRVMLDPAGHPFCLFLD